MTDFYKPDFSNLKNTLLCRESRCTSWIELHIDKEFKERYLLRQIKSLEDEIGFSLRLCHDFILVSKGILKPQKVLASKQNSGDIRWA